MKKPRDIYSLAALAVALLYLTFGCARAPQPAEEQPATEPAEWQDARGFDPLELPRDKEVIPEVHPLDVPLQGRQGLVEVGQSNLPFDTASAQTPEIEVQADSANSQVFRVQLMSSRVYSEARYGARVAEEIFDQPVYVDYEVPNYKVRVGNFADRLAAEDYQQRAKAAGYSNAWVVVVNIKVKEASPLYEGSPEGPVEPKGEKPDTATVTDDGQ